MIHRRNSVDLLDNTLSALEHLILSAPDAEVLSFSSAGPRATCDITALIARKLANHEVPPPQASTTTAPHARAKGKRPVVPSRERATNVELLRRLAAMRPELSPQLSAVFSAGKVPSSKELDVLTEELVRLGILPAGKPGDK